MLLIYNFFVAFYLILIFISSFFNKKAKKWLSGRKNNNVVHVNKSIWFHFASLGEFEQGRPVLEAIRPLTDCVIVVTFFSPSGYEAKKNSPLADYIYYLPLDSATNSVQFINAINPIVACFTKYEYWYHYFNELNKKQIPLFIVSGIFRPNQIFFKWYGSLHRKILGFVTHFFVQDEGSKQLLEGVGIKNASVCNDTRFDRVWENALSPQTFAEVKNFKGKSNVFIAGSSWPEDEELVASLIPLYPDWKFIFAPHEISESKIAKLRGLLPKQQTILYSDLVNLENAEDNYKILIIDNIGKLSSLYQYAEIAYIGGGFGAGIHNTLEAAAFSRPVIFGPKYQKFKEARDLVALKLGFSINNLEELKLITSKLINDPAKLAAIGNQTKAYVKDHTGATSKIINYISHSVKLKG